MLETDLRKTRTWKVLDDGTRSPCFRVEEVLLDDATCETLFGFTGNVLLHIFDLADADGAFSLTPTYSPDRLRELHKKGILSPVLSSTSTLPSVSASLSASSSSAASSSGTTLN